VTLSTVDVAHVLISLVVLVVVAHMGAHIFKKLRQPPVIGEIIGGLLLGPTVLGALLPRVREWLLPSEGPAAHALGIFYELGLLLLVYLTGIELRGQVARAERRTIVSVAVAGLVVPFAAGLLVARVLGVEQLSGPQGSPITVALVFSMAIAITSVPVISRIMLDLGILGTVFAKIVLAVAVLEDVVLYVILAIVLGIAQAQSGDTFGIGGLVSSHSLPWAIVYFSLVPIVFLLLCLWRGRQTFDGLSTNRWNFVEKRSPTAFRLAFLLTLCVLCTELGIDPMFGALAAGLCGSGGQPDENRSQETLRTISLAFFVPVYFAVVGLKLDLIRHFDVVFFLWFLVFACVVKSASVWAGARLAGQDSASAGNIAIAMNARGGPGILLASVTFGAGVISEDFFTCLVAVSMVTSQVAGAWLGWTVARRRPLLSYGSHTPALEAEGDQDNRRKAETT
jgi:Kef-type K+ transport system membrane component KefB